MNVQVFEDGELVDEYDDGQPPPSPQPVEAATLIASIAAMSDDQKQQLREALAL